MMRQSSSRNQRSKGGFKLRHFIQVFLLVAICIWLVYQVKHSRDKKRAFEERKVVEAQPLPLRFSRRDLPVVHESALRIQTHRSVVDEDESEVEDKEEEEQDSKKEEAQDEEGKGGVDDWIDEQDQDRRGEENEQEFMSEEDNETPVEEMDSGHSQGHEDSAVGAIKENHRRETHSNAVETGFADERTLDDKNLRIGDADMRGNSSIGAAVVSKFDNFSAMADFNGSMINSSISSLGENTTFPEATNHPMNGTPTEKNGSTLGYINQNEMQTNSTAALPEAISMTTSSNSSVESYGEIPGNKTSNLIHFADENPAKFVEPVHEHKDKGKSKTGEEESDEHLKNGSLVANEGDMLHNGATKEERIARADLGVAGG